MSKKALLLVLAGIILLAGIALGFSLRTEENVNKLKDLNPTNTGCTYKNKTYKEGESFPAGDGCNTCGCNDGEINCTLIACNTQ
ncbi:hypothetical protein HY357_00335 [Candidatus Roizmanbacteria bacterium]|nr:hypothetical protein [Candidatus Roizmanbacteria bacterium]